MGSVLLVLIALELALLLGMQDWRGSGGRHPVGRSIYRYERWRKAKRGWRG